MASPACSLRRITRLRSLRDFCEPSRVPSGGTHGAMPVASDIRSSSTASARLKHYCQAITECRVSDVELRASPVVEFNSARRDVSIAMFVAAACELAGLTAKGDRSAHRFRV